MLKKRIFAAAMILCLLLSACGTKASEPAPSPKVENTPEPTPEPTEAPLPETISAYARVNNAELLYSYLGIGEEIEIIGEKGAYYAFERSGVKLFAEKRFIRLEDEEEFLPQKVYSNGNAAIYPDVYLQGELLATLGVNEEVTLLALMGHTALIQYGDIKAYAEYENLNNEPIYYNYSSGGESAPAPSQGQDGGDIELGFRYKGGGIVNLAAGDEEEISPLPKQKGYVLGDKLEAYLWIYGLNEEVKLTVVGEDSCETLVKGNLGRIKSWMLELPDREPYEKWQAYGVNSPVFYEDYRLLGGGEVLALNTELEVIFETETFYIVKLQDGRIGYMEKNQLSRTPFVYVDYGGGGSSASGGGAEWTEPVL